MLTKFDLDKEFKLIWEQVNSNKGNHPSQIQAACLNLDYETAKLNILNLNNKFYNSIYPKLIEETFTYVWRKVDREIFKRLDRIFECEMRRLYICNYLTTCTTLPYSPEYKYFFTNIFTSPFKQIKTSIHELIHLYFHEFYMNMIIKELGSKEAYKLKEALTVIINIEFFDLTYSKDDGYTEHKQLRDKITKLWVKNEDTFLSLYKKLYSNKSNVSRERQTTANTTETKNGNFNRISKRNQSKRQFNKTRAV